MSSTRMTSRQPDEFEHFNAFFYRQLKPAARPMTRTRTPSSSRQTGGTFVSRTCRETMDCL